jgi:hypothetical protein
LPHTELIFPLEDGQSRIYLVEDTSFTVQAVVTDRFYRQELINGTEEDLSGREVSRLETYRSEDSLGTNFDFMIDRVWTAFKDPHYAERIEENVRRLMLKFPVSIGVEWNSNQFNSMGSQRYTYQVLDSTLVLNGMTFQNCVLVIEKADTSGFINNKFAYTLYAPDIGKIKSFDRTMVCDGANATGEPCSPDNPGFNPDKSFIHSEILVSHN